MSDFLYDGESSSNQGESDETSEVDFFGREIFSPGSVLKERIDNFKRQLKELSSGSHAEYLKRVEELEQAHREAQDTIRAWQEYEFQQVEEDHQAEKEAALGEFRVKKEEMRDSMVNELSEKRKTVDVERQMMDLAGDTSDFKPRRPTLRPHKGRDANTAPPPEKRRKPAAQLGVLFPVDDEDALGDISAIFKGKIPVSLRSVAMVGGIMSAASPQKSLAVGGGSGVASDSSLPDIRLEDGRLYYDKKVFVRGQPVYLEARDGTRTNGTVQSIGQNEFWIRRTTGDQGRMRLQLSALLKGKYTIHKRGI